MIQTVNAGVVPGEIKAARDRRLQIKPDDVIDAEFETIRADGSKASHIGQRQISLRALTAAPTVAPKFMFAKPGGAAFWLSGMTLVASAFWFSGGHTLARGMWPGGEAVALTISGLTARVDASGSRPLLLVDGTTSNEGTRRVELPFLTISVSAEDGSVTRYKLGTSSPSLGPGERFAFSSRLDVPRSGVRSVAVTFAE